MFQNYIYIVHGKTMFHDMLRCKSTEQQIYLAAPFIEQYHEILDFRLFWWTIFPEAPDYIPQASVRIFFTKIRKKHS